MSADPSATSPHRSLTAVGAGTLMGGFMRCYWLPVARSSEVVADGAPLRLLVLGEKLIAFRDSAGRVGVMDHRCPHRSASLFLGRNEGGGIRCVYHGWKFAVDGRCLEMPNVPPEQCFAHRVRAHAYRVAERHGVIWAYLGPRQDAPPPLPAIEATWLPEHELDLSFTLRRCNWLQALEGDIDPSHFGFLHVGHLDPAQVPAGHPLEHTANDRAPRIETDSAPWGTRCAAWRVARPGVHYWRVTNAMFPFWTQTPGIAFARNIQARAWVPLDDEHTMFIYWRRRGEPAPNAPLADGQPLGGTERTPDHEPNGTGWLDRFRPRAQEANDWLLDRQAQSSGRNWSGLRGLSVQDQAVTESMDPVVDHRIEHLGPADRMIVLTRKRWLDAARAVQQGGLAPGADDAELLRDARSGFFEADAARDWRLACGDQLSRADRAQPPLSPPLAPQAAEAP
jgi:phthalate 4,5-dioxygenase oxygenase subunit